MICSFFFGFDSDFRGKVPFVGVFSYRLPELLILDSNLVNEIFVGKFRNFHLNYTNVIIPKKFDILSGKSQAEQFKLAFFF